MCRKVENGLLVMERRDGDKFVYAPMYVHEFKVIQSRKVLDAGKFLAENPDFEKIGNTADKLRWYRHKFGLTQKDVAKCAGIDRKTYFNFETTTRDYYPIDAMQRIAKMYNADVRDLLDEYNLFLYNGQGRQVKERRKQKRMTQSEFAALIGVPLGTLKEWEKDRIMMKKKTWERLVKVW